MIRIPTHIDRIQPPPITEVKSWLTGRTFPATKPLVDLCQAIPDYPPAEGLIKHLTTQLSDPKTYKYSPDEGLAEVRNEVCSWYQRRYLAGPKADQLCLTIGASQAFWLAIAATCQPGDEVIVQLPAYFDHPMGLQALGVTPVFADFNPTTAGQPEPSKIAGLVTDKTRAILLVTPSNPTGAVIAPATLADFLSLAQQQNIALILDETYNAFIPGAPHQLFQNPDWPENFIHLASFGKTFALTGLRCGALIAAADIIRQALKIQDSMVVCQPKPAQISLAYGCRMLDDWVSENSQAMQQRHDLFVAEFLKAKTAFELVASGSFFAWTKHPWPALTGRQAARKLATEENLICLPGEAFGPGLEPYLRLAFGNLKNELIPLAIERLAEIE